MKKKGFHLLEKSLDALFADAVENEFFSGAVAAILLHEKGAKKSLIKAYGRTRNDKKGVEVNEESVFDLASLTKPLCTTLCILSLIEDKKIRWGSTLKGSLNNRMEPCLEFIKVEQLLSHSSGLKDYKPFFMDFKPEYSTRNKNEIIHKILQESLVYIPGEKCMYSDLGFILLGEIIEQTSGVSLDKYFMEKITGPLQLDECLYFRPLGRRMENKQNMVATELCPWRNRLIQGEVHDEHCWLMGGIAGHAGLFGKAEGVLKLAENILNQWRGRSENRSYSHVLLQEALERRYPGETWGMGFDRPSPKGSSAGKYLSKNSVGHLGYTGTSFWIDPVRDLILVLLTNRVYPSRKNKKIKKFRPLFHNTVIEKLGLK